MQDSKPGASIPKIDLLPEHLIDQIKAGEVIERPGNLLKEILENAVDAKSTSLEIHLRNNGLDLISIKDNGHGMRFSDLPLAFSRHATSKISRFEDLYRLHTFGFRGEALASIASISKLQCISKTSQEASEIRIEGGATVFHGTRLNDGQSGTELIIQDLFYNTPARLKFIQSQSSEKQFLKRILFSFILSHPEIEFAVKFDDDEKEIFEIKDSLQGRIEDILPKAKGLVQNAQRFYENNEVQIFLIPTQVKTPGKWQFVFINERFVLDKQLHRVVSNAMLSSFGHDDFSYIVLFDLPADSIDVNVHPSKTIIKCLESSKMISLLTSTIKEISGPVKRPEPPSAHIPGLFEHPSLAPSILQQERHEYNMDGIFSPHGLIETHSDSLQWIGDFFIITQNGTHEVLSAKRLIDQYLKKKMALYSSTIPLLVSEPYPAKECHKDQIDLMNSAGFELEYLGFETLVIRGIPEWMNGLPLTQLAEYLLKRKSFDDFPLELKDWTQSSWLEMMQEFSLPERLQLKISYPLETLLKEKFK